MKRLYIDFDGVIMNTIEISYNNMKRLGIKQEDQEAVRTYYKLLDWKMLLEEASILNDAMNCIQKIRNSKRFEVTILSHVNSLEEAIEKVKFIRIYFKDITIIPVPRALSKTEMVHVENAILIDDYAGNLSEWQEKGGIGVRFNLDLKGKGFEVIDKLDQILDMSL